MQQNQKTSLFDISSIFFTLFFLLTTLETYAENLPKQSTANGTADTQNQKKQRLITGISTYENSDSVTVEITCNTRINYLSAKQTLESGLVLHFPETSYQVSNKVFDIDNSIINDIKVKEPGNKIRSSITISLKHDSPYQISSEDGKVIRIEFTKVTQEPESIQTEIPKQNKLIAIIPETDNDRFRLVVETTSRVDNVKTLTLTNPPRIVFDLYNVQSKFNSQQTRIPVVSHWVAAVRYLAYPEKVRVVLDTRRELLEAFSTELLDDGFIAVVGPHVSGSDPR